MRIFWKWFSSPTEAKISPKISALESELEKLKTLTDEELNNAIIQSRQNLVMLLGASMELHQRAHLIRWHGQDLGERGGDPDKLEQMARDAFSKFADGFARMG